MRNIGQFQKKTAPIKLRGFRNCFEECYKTRLLALANEQKNEGKNDLAEFVLCRSEKSHKELICCTWKMHNASSDFQQEKMP